MRPPVTRSSILLAGMLLSTTLLSTTALAQSHTPGGMPPPSGTSLADSATMRFPQPVRVGKLLRRPVLRPVESQTVLGRVAELVRNGDGTISVVVDYGGFLGIGTRPIAVPLDAMALDGAVLEVVAYTPRQLRDLPTFSSAGSTPVPADATVKVGLAKPSH